MKNLIIALALIVTSSSAFAREAVCNINGKNKQISGCRVKIDGLFCTQSHGLFSDSTTYTSISSEGGRTFKVTESTVYFQSDVMKKQESFEKSVSGVKCRF